MRSLEFATDEQKQDEVFVLEKVKKNGLAIKYAAEKLQRSRPIVEAAADQNLLALKYAAPEFQKDHKIIMKAVKADAENWQHVEKMFGGLAETQNFVLEAVKEELMKLHIAPEKLRSHDVVLEAVKKEGLSLRWAPDELKGDRQIVLEAVRSDGRAWQFATDELRADKEILMEAVRRDELAKGSVEKGDHEAAGDAESAMWWSASELCQDRAVTLKANGDDGPNGCAVEMRSRTQ